MRDSFFAARQFGEVDDLNRRAERLKMPTKSLTINPICLDHSSAETEVLWFDSIGIAQSGAMRS